MKTTFKFIIAAMAAISVFSSCQKELANETVNNTTGGVRTIAVQFDNSTKATLDGFTPKFANGDAIRVSNTEKSEECTVSVDGSGNATFSTTLSGDLTAIYPADAAVFTGNGPISDPFFKVPASQDGDVAKAIIAKAEIAVGSTSATFTSQTALFQITPPSGATTFTITSLKPVVDGVARTGEAVAINTDGATDAAKLVITVSNNDLTTFYVALKAGVNLSDLSFEYTTDATHGAMKGITKNAITAAGGTDQTAANTKYTIDDKNWHPYVTIGGKKWATENVGATTSNPCGTYFDWGNTTGHALKESSVGGTGTITTAFVGDYKFSWANCPYQTENTLSLSATRFTKYLGSTTSSKKHATATDADAMKTVLDLVDDAAYVNWGGAWRMPTGGTDANSDFTALAKAAKSDYSSDSISPSSQVEVPTSRGVFYYNVDGSKGLYFVDESGNKLFFPATGSGGGTSLYNAGSYGYYWSSSLYASTPEDACRLEFNSDNVNPQYYCYRYNGFPVRPVSDL